MTLDEVERRLKTADRLVFDVETSGLDWKRDYICGWVLGFGPTLADTAYLPVRHASANLDPDRVAACIRAGIYSNRNIRLQGFNLGFDLKFVSREGVILDMFDLPFEDGQIYAFLIDEYRRSFSLDACAEDAGATAKKGDELYKHMAAKFGGEPKRDQMKNFYRLDGDDPLAVDYATGDSISTWDLIDRQQTELDNQALRTVWDVECRCIRALTRMELLGVKVDEERLAQVRGVVAQQLEMAKAKLPAGLNSRAPTQMVRLFTDNGLKDQWPTTQTGKPSFPEAWLLTNPIGESIVRVRKLENLESSFFGPLIERHIFEGRVHTTFNQTRGEEFGTVTGRLSSSDPNMQQVHKRNVSLGALFRSVFVPDDGKLMAGCDYNQCEPRLLAHYAKVKLLIEGYLNDPPIDAHSMVAKAASIPRQAGKTLNQALLTGAGSKKAASMLGLPMVDAMKIVDAYFESMPEIKTAQRNISDVFINRNYLCSILGRRMRLDDVRFAYRGINRLLQGGNADIIKLSMARIDEHLTLSGSDTQMLLNVHDDIVFQYPIGDHSDLDRSIETMCDFGPGRGIELAVPMEVDAGTGRNWAEATYGEDTVRGEFKKLGADYER